MARLKTSRERMADYTALYRSAKIYAPEAVISALTNTSDKSWDLIAAEAGLLAKQLVGEHKNYLGVAGGCGWTELINYKLMHLSSFDECFILDFAWNCDPVRTWKEQVANIPYLDAQAHHAFPGSAIKEQAKLWHKLKDVDISRFHAVRASADAIPFQDGSIDLATCGLSQHLFEDRDEFVNELFRVLGPDAYAVITDHHPNAYCGDKRAMKEYGAFGTGRAAKEYYGRAGFETIKCSHHAQEDDIDDEDMWLIVLRK